MKERIMAFFQSEKVRRCVKRVFNKKTILTSIVILAVVLALRISFSLMFEIKGTVKGIDGKNITVANFLNTRTVDVGDYPIEQIQVGDRIEITKNLNGDVLFIRDEYREHNGGKSNMIGNGKQNFKERNNHKGNR